MVQNLYATRDQLKARLGLSDTGQDETVDALLYTASREVDTWTGRQFFTTRETRYFTPRDEDELAVDDLLAVTSVKTDPDGDRTYPNTLSSTDYDLHPPNSTSMSPPRPYWRLDTAPRGVYYWPEGIARSVQIVGTWGFYDVQRTSAATLAEALDTSETGVDVSDGTAFSTGQIVEIDSERMEIQAISSNTLTVERAINGTTVATHSSAAAIRVTTYPIVGEATLHQAALELRGQDAPLGIQGSPEYGQQIRAVGLHPFVQNMLRPFRTPRVG